MRKSSHRSEADERLHGLVLAGGRGTRLGRDKGALDYHGEPQAVWALRLLEPWCSRSFVSIRPDQAGSATYRGLATIVDRGGSAGPASGLAAAMQAFPGVAWLVIAADMPLLTHAVLDALVARRDRSRLATAYRHHDGVPEPLCAVWEPAASGLLTASPGEGRGGSLRRLLEAGPARLLDVDDDAALGSVNTAADDARVRAELASRAVRVM